MPRRDRVEEYPDELLERLKRVHDHGDMFAHLIEKANRDEEAVRVLSGARHLEMDIHPKLAFEFHLLARLRGEPGFRAYHLPIGPPTLGRGEDLIPNHAVSGAEPSLQSVEEGVVARDYAVLVGIGVVVEDEKGVVLRRCSVERWNRSIVSSPSMTPSNTDLGLFA